MCPVVPGVGLLDCGLMLRFDLAVAEFVSDRGEHADGPAPGRGPDTSAQDGPQQWRTHSLAVSQPLLADMPGKAAQQGDSGLGAAFLDVVLAHPGGCGKLSDAEARAA